MTTCKHGWDWRKYESCPMCADYQTQIAALEKTERKHGREFDAVERKIYEEAFEAGAAHEREECAKVCEEVAGRRTHALEFKFRLSAQECATNIRMRHNAGGKRSDD